MAIRCLIFDCDGVLVDSERLGIVAFADAFAPLGAVLSVDDCLAQYRGWQLAAMIEDVERRCAVKTDDNFVARYRALERALFETDLQPIPGVREMLDALFLPKCVASSGPPAKIRHSLQLTGLAPHFGQNVFSAYDINRWKPAPDLFLHAAHHMGFAPAACAVIEDSHVGVMAGLAAGMRVFQYAPDSGEIHAGAVRLREMAELPELLLEMGIAL
ncbi:MAG: HAD-IA family hydrolase [Caldilineaceae bacterium]